MTQLKVDGMSCGKCVEFVTKALQSVPGVEVARVDLESGRAEVEGDTPVAQLVHAVEEEGYTASAA
ncbi:MAG TPA: cation transporter [Abditibacteriaceae bacterium]|jgi:copper chaperone CopZ